MNEQTTENEPQKLKRIILKEEFVALTGHHIPAIILNQFLYWAERTKNVDAYFREEAERAGGDSEIELTHGWIYKTADDLTEETMLGATNATMRKYTKQLVEAGWLQERNNPAHKWDRTLQYRVNILKLQADLMALGYVLDGYSLPFLNSKNGGSKIKNRSSESENRTAKNLSAIPETTTETTTETTRKDRAASGDAPRGANAPPPSQPASSPQLQPEAQDTGSQSEATPPSPPSSAPPPAPPANGAAPGASPAPDDAGAPANSDATATLPDIPDALSMTVKALRAWAKTATPEQVQAVIATEQARIDRDPRSGVLSLSAGDLGAEQTLYIQRLVWLVKGSYSDEAFALLPKGEQARFSSAAKKFREYGATKDDLDGWWQWWRTEHWIGRQLDSNGKHKRPGKPEQILSTWLEFEAWRNPDDGQPTTNGSSPDNAGPNDSADGSRYVYASAEEWDRYYAAQGAAAS